MDDLISRQAVIDTLDRMDKVLDEDRTVEIYRDLLKECYTVLPSVNPQEPVLDKIRAEIEARLCDVVSDYTDGYRTAIQGALAIIDNYKEEVR